MVARDYQINIAEQAADMLRTKSIAYLVMQVRTGKTLTAFLTAEKLGVENVLFVSKLKAIPGIQSDFEKYGGQFFMTFINYESLHKLKGNFDLIILDEAHCLGQFPIPAKRTELLKEICAYKPILYLSGTPTPETYSQWFHQFWVSSFSPFPHRNFYKWHHEYGIPKTKYVYNRELNDYSEVIAETINPIVNPYLLTWTQQEAGFEMPVDERIVTIPMPERIALAVKIMRRDKIIQTKSGATVLGDTAVKELGKIHQICSGTVKDEDGGFHLISDYKTRYIAQHYQGRKIAIFYKFQAELELLRQTFGNRLIFCPESFNAAGPDRVFVSQIQSGREGINIATADVLIMLNIDFSATSYWQSRARLQTKDRKTPALVHWIFAEGGIEKYVYGQVSKKKDFTVSHYHKINMD